MSDDNNKPARLMESIKVIASEITVDDRPKTAIVVVLENEELGTAMILDEDQASALIEQIRNARDYAIKANLSRNAFPEARA
jgi:hypothetical protein